MADIELVVKIDEEEYMLIKQKMQLDLGGVPSEAERVIANGTPLPKEHGDLIDRDAVNNRYDSIYAELHSYSNQPTYKELLDKLSVCLDTAPTIIEANKEVENA